MKTKIYNGESDGDGAFFDDEFEWEDDQDEDLEDE